MLDIVIRGATVVDGSGAEGFTADVGVQDGMIVELGKVATAAHRTIDAAGLVLTPGFIDLHTHYDGQALWDDQLDPSFSNGVTTAFLGNCGVGFAPVRPGGQDRLVDLMDGVEEIPGSVLAAGLDWKWNSFPEYMDRLDAKARTINVGALMTHGPLRLYVMGDKVESRTPASADEIAAMQAMVDEGLQAGAWGLSSSRTPVHTSRSGKMTPDFDVAFEELRALAEVTGRQGAMFEFAPNGIAGEDLEGLRRDTGFLERLACETGSAVHLLVSQTRAYPEFWREQLAAMDRVAAAGGRMFGQVSGRGIGVLFGLFNTNPFEARETYRKVMDLPDDAARLKAFAEPEVRAKILAEPGTRGSPIGNLLHSAYALKDLDFEPGPERSLTVLGGGTQAGVEAAAYDLMLEDGFLFVPVLNYFDGNLEVARSLISHPHCLLAASDAGAHSLTVCDGAMSTFMLSHWTRDRRRGERLALEEVVRLMTSKPAEAVGLASRGRIAQGMIADLNLIDMEAVAMESPRVVRDLPAGGARLLQRGRGYRATLVSGIVTSENDTDTGERPGRLLRRG